MSPNLVGGRPSPSLERLLAAALAEAWAAQTPLTKPWNDDAGQPLPSHIVAQALATPAGRRLTAVVEAAVAWRKPLYYGAGELPDSLEDDLLRAVDALEPPDNHAPALAPGDREPPAFGHGPESPVLNSASAGATEP